jgi:hypothetical protein
MQNKRISELASASGISANDLLITSEYNGVSFDSKSITGFDASQSLRLLAPVLWTIDLMDSTSVDIYAPYALSIDSVANVKNSPTTTILKNGSAYTLGTSIASGDTINVSVSTASVINLNITQL